MNHDPRALSATSPLHWVAFQSSAIKSDRAVLFAITAFIHPHFNCGWPSNKALAKAAGVNKRTVQRAKVSLQEIGELRVWDGFGSFTARGRTDLYALPSFPVTVRPIFKGDKIIGESPWGDVLSPHDTVSPKRPRGIEEGKPLISQPFRDKSLWGDTMSPPPDEIAPVDDPEQVPTWEEHPEVQKAAERWERNRKLLEDLKAKQAST